MNKSATKQSRTVTPDAPPDSGVHQVVSPPPIVDADTWKKMCDFLDDIEGVRDDLSVLADALSTDNPSTESAFGFVLRLGGRVQELQKRGPFLLDLARAKEAKVAS